MMWRYPYSSDFADPLNLRRELNTPLLLRRYVLLPRRQIDNDVRSQQSPVCRVADSHAYLSDTTHARRGAVGCILTRSVYLKATLQSKHGEPYRENGQ
jgi:hypothetical protein